MNRLNILMALVAVGSLAIACGGLDSSEGDPRCESIKAKMASCGLAAADLGECGAEMMASHEKIAAADCSVFEIDGKAESLWCPKRCIPYGSRCVCAGGHGWETLGI